MDSMTTAAIAIINGHGHGISVKVDGCCLLVVGAIFSDLPLFSS
jgi:hypothetical protein